MPGSLSVRGSFRPEQCRTLLTSLAKQHIQEEIAHKKVGYRLTAIAPVLYSSRYNLLSAGSGRGVSEELVGRNRGRVWRLLNEHPITGWM